MFDWLHFTSILTGVIMIIEAIITVYLVVKLSKSIPRPSLIPLSLMALVIVAAAFWSLLVILGLATAASEFGFYVVRSIMVVLMALPSWVMLALSGPCSTCPYLPPNYGKGDKQ
jgi:hypothetical protein